MSTKALKRWLPDVVAVVLFALVAFAYFFPADTEGRILFQHDASAGRGMGVEIEDYRARTGETPRWTNTLFSGMPTFQMAPSYDSGNILKQVGNAFHLWLPDYVMLVFGYLLGFYILLRALRFRQSLAVLGAIMWAFSSYFFIIIAAGHIWKVNALIYLPPMIAGIVLAYRGKYLLGFLLTALFTGLEVNANHVQMTYYYLFIVFFMLVAFFVDAWRKKELPRFAKASAVCVVAAAIGVCMNISNLYHTWQYSKESMRGKSELVKQDTANQTDSGLERDYITQWSYGIGETWTLLVPNAKGGASVSLANNAVAMEKANPTYAQIYRQIGQYWGEQPGTSGPVYVGAFVLMLFFLGLFIVKGPMKWALLAATVLSILLSWGHNFMWFTNLFIDHMPMYSKFRTVSSILVMAEFTIPLLAMLALKRVVDDPAVLTKKIKFVYASFALTGGVALLFALLPSVFFPNYVSSMEMQQLSQLPSEHLQPLIANLTEMRKAIFTADCWRSFWVVAIGTIILLLYKARKLKAAYMIGGIAVLCLVDMWQVNKRYLNDSMFVNKSVREQPVAMTDAEREILKDDDIYYRTLNLATNTFNENETSYYLKSIGGYHPAKLRRYQEMIEQYIAPEMRELYQAAFVSQGDLGIVNGDSLFKVLNMLNTKYVILPVQSGQTIPLRNPHAFGNAWMVDNVTYVDNANYEMDAVGRMDLRHEAVADSKFEAVLGQSCRQDSSSVVTLTAYEPNSLTYDVSSSKGGVIVFSEVYYPGWTATVDGEAVEVGRVNYLLRAIKVEPGDHEVVLSFFPKSVSVTETIAYAASGVLLVCVVVLVFLWWRRRDKATAPVD